MTDRARPADDAGPDERLDLFVYGTLLPGQERWGFLEPFVESTGVEMAVHGDLYDTGFGYPAAIFERDSRYRGGTIWGRRFGLLASRYVEALDELDRVEGSVEGLYHRVAIPVGDGTNAWAYQVGDTLRLTPIVDGDWRSWHSTTTT